MFYRGLCALTHLFFAIQLILNRKIFTGRIQLMTALNMDDTSSHENELSSDVSIDEITTQGDTQEMDLTFRTKTWRDDMSLVVQGRKFHVSSAVISLFSPVFNKTLERIFRTSGDSPRELEIEGQECDNVLEFLQCLYPNIQKNIDVDNVLKVLPLAVKYETKSLRERCISVLLTQISAEAMAVDLCNYLRAACTLELVNIKELCISVLSESNYEDFIEAEGTVSLPLDTKMEIQRKMLMAQSRKVKDLKSMNKNYERILKKVNIEKLWFDSLPTENNDFANRIVGYLDHNFCFPDKAGEFALSQGIYIYGLKWSILIKNSDGSNLGIFLKAEVGRQVTSWSCKAHAVLVLHNFKDETESLSRTIYHNFTADKNDWGFSKFTSMKTVRNSKNGFMDEGKIQVEIKFVAAEPCIELDH